MDLVSSLSRVEKVSDTNPVYLVSIASFLALPTSSQLYFTMFTVVQRKLLHAPLVIVTGQIVEAVTYVKESESVWAIIVLMGLSSH